MSLKGLEIEQNYTLGTNADMGLSIGDVAFDSRRNLAAKTTCGLIKNANKSEMVTFRRILSVERYRKPISGHPLAMSHLTSDAT